MVDHIYLSALMTQRAERKPVVPDAVAR